jgi:deazaflavin-dependent oxidoreductase (nitroreductase family)
MARRQAISPRYERVLSPAAMDRLRRIFRSMNRGMVVMWRMGLGRWADAWPSVGGRVLVVEHHGRKSGTQYLTPLNFASDRDSRYCLAAFGTGADWYRNVFAADRAVLWLPDGRWTATATDATDEAGAREWIRQVLIDSGFAARLFGLNPRTMTNDEIDATTATYRLVRFDVIDRCDEGFEDLLWVWLPVTAGAVAIASRSMVRRHRT